MVCNGLFQEMSVGLRHMISSDGNTSLCFIFKRLDQRVLKINFLETLIQELCDIDLDQKKVLVVRLRKKTKKKVSWFNFISKRVGSSGCQTKII